MGRTVANALIFRTQLDDATAIEWPDFKEQVNLITCPTISKKFMTPTKDYIKAAKPTLKTLVDHKAMN